MAVKMGYGVAPKKIFCDPDLSIGAKALSGVLLSFQGKGENSYPSLSLLSHLLGKNRHTIQTYIKELCRKPYFSKTRKRRVSENQKFANNVYLFDMNALINEEIDLEPQAGYPPTENPPTGYPPTENLPTKNNSIKNNSIKNNSDENYSTPSTDGKQKEGDLLWLEYKKYLDDTGNLPVDKTGWIILNKAYRDTCTEIVRRDGMELAMAVFEFARNDAFWGKTVLNPGKYPQWRAAYKKKYPTGKSKTWDEFEAMLAQQEKDGII